MQWSHYVNTVSFVLLQDKMSIFCKNEHHLMSLTIFHLNPILVIMIEMNIKHFYFIRENLEQTVENFFIFQIYLYLREIIVLSGFKMFYFTKRYLDSCICIPWVSDLELDVIRTAPLEFVFQRGISYGALYSLHFHSHSSINVIG